MPDRSIVHMDLDSFFASVEILRNPTLAGKPVIVGGSAERGVVASCNYEARKYGVRSAMSGKQAKQLCPHAIFVRGEMSEYVRYSQLVREIIASKAPLFEQSSIDEFYLDLTGIDKFFGVWKWTTELRKQIMKETGLPISFGLSINKMVSKIATGEAKPNGQLQVLPGEEKNFLAPMPVEKIPMVGKKMTEQLHQAGIMDIKTLSNTSLSRLQSIFGNQARVLLDKANGIDHSPVRPYSERKSVSTETTFEQDLIDDKYLRNTILKMTEQLAFSIRKKQNLTSCAALKIRYSNFETALKQCSFPDTFSDTFLMKKVSELFEQLYQKRQTCQINRCQIE